MTYLENGELCRLISGVARNDRDAFATLYQRAAPKLFSILLRILKNRGLAEEALQDVFLKVWQNAESFVMETGPAMGWLVTITRNRAIDILRTKNPAAPRAAQMEDFFATLTDSTGGETQITNRAALAHCLGALEEPARTCILLAYCEGYSREELAGRFDRPVGTIKTWLHRTLAVLKSCMEATQ